MEPISGAQALVRELESLGTETIFGYPGGAIMPIYDALVDSTLKHILVRHEQGAALAACGYARVSGRVGVCLATSGPGATNLVTGIADAFLDSVPLVAITGQVPSAMMGTDAFQEVDIFGITLPVVKHSFIVRSADEMGAIVRQAFEIAASGRPGPVLIDVPKDVAAEITTATSIPHVESGNSASTPRVSEEQLRRATVMIGHARKPLIYVGGGVARSGATAAFRRFAKTLQVPVVTSLHGIGTLPTGDDLLLGMLGMHGHKAANFAVQDADLLICLGVRFDDRATGRLNAFAPKAKVLHVDIDRTELGKLRQPHLAIHGDVGEFLQRIVIDESRSHSWRNACQSSRKTQPSVYDAPGDSIYAPEFVAELTSRDPNRWIVTCDVGQHQMWVAQHGRFAEPFQHISSGGLGTMGFGIPAGIGAKLARPDKDVVVISGDGSFLMNVQELATIRRYRIPLRIVLFDNSGLGLVRQWQTLFFDERFSEVDLPDNPDFVAVAEAFGIRAFRCDSRDAVSDAIDALESATGPLLIHVPIDARANVWPLVPPNGANHEMMEEACKTS
jgi:acetolactate synthase-1/2/3 large subunit